MLILVQHTSQPQKNTEVLLVLKHYSRTLPFLLFSQVVIARYFGYLLRVLEMVKRQVIGRQWKRPDLEIGVDHGFKHGVNVLIDEVVFEASAPAEDLTPVAYTFYLLFEHEVGFPTSYLFEFLLRIRIRCLESLWRGRRGSVSLWLFVLALWLHSSIQKLLLESYRANLI